MYILDTCILNILLFYPGAKREAVTRNLNMVDRGDVYVSAISVYELIGGAVSEINRTLNSLDVIPNLEALTKLVNKLSAFNILPFTERAHLIFEQLPASTKRRGPMDARIASNALSFEGFIVVTEDEEVFGLAGVPVADWTRLST